MSRNVRYNVNTNFFEKKNANEDADYAIKLREEEVRLYMGNFSRSIT